MHQALFRGIVNSHKMKHETLKHIRRAPGSVDLSRARLDWKKLTSVDLNIPINSLMHEHLIQIRFIYH
jgi:hypothetical protein